MRAMLDGFRDMQNLVDSPDRIIPGHDPLIIKNFPAASAKLEGKVVRLD
jgi:hypothetical protein